MFIAPHIRGHVKHSNAAMRTPISNVWRSYAKMRKWWPRNPTFILLLGWDRHGDESYTKVFSFFRCGQNHQVYGTGEAKSGKLAFSSILPKTGHHLIPGINKVNDRVARAGRYVGYGYFNHRDFIVDRKGEVECSLYTKSDPTGTHLSSRGFRALDKSLARFTKLWIFAFFLLLFC